MKNKKITILASISLTLTIAAMAFMLVKYPLFAYVALAMTAIVELLTFLLPSKLKDEDDVPPQEIKVAHDVTIRRMDVEEAAEEVAEGCKRVALLIDADNIESWLIYHIIKNIGLFHDAVVVYSCLYGNKPAMYSWKKAVDEFGFKQCFSEQYVIGKNSTDFKILIDCMDLLYQGDIDTFVICSSDSDFKNIADRLTMNGKTVIGMGMQTAPQIYRDSCTSFVNLSECVWRNDVYEVIEEEAKANHGITDCNVVARRVKEMYDYRDLGYSSISEMVRDLGLTVQGSDIILGNGMPKQKEPKKEPEWKIQSRAIIHEMIEENGGSVSISVAKHRVTKECCYHKVLGFDDFNSMVKSLGFKLTKDDHGKYWITEKARKKSTTPA